MGAHLTRRAAVRQSDIVRALKAAERAGLRVVGIRPSDGVVLLDNESPPPKPSVRQDEGASWDD